MPTFECDDCGERFNSKTKLQQHTAAQHTADDTEESGISGWIQGMRNLFTWKGGLTLVGIILMIALPLGGTAYYSSLAPEQSGDDGSTNTIETEPPTGMAIAQGNARLPTQPSTLQLRTHYTRELSSEEQVYLLHSGGPSDLFGIRPGFLLQYNCTDCSGIIEDVQGFADSMNGGGSEVWVRTAPNTAMDDRVALTFPAALTRSVPRTYDTFNATRVQSFICDMTIAAGNRQYAMESIGPGACAF